MISDMQTLIQAKHIKGEGALIQQMLKYNSHCLKTIPTCAYVH